MCFSCTYTHSLISHTHTQRNVEAHRSFAIGDWAMLNLQPLFPGQTEHLKARLGSLAGQLAVKAGQRDGEGLQGTHRVVKVHGEDVFCHTTELHHNVVGCRISAHTVYADRFRFASVVIFAAYSRSLSWMIWKFLTEA